MTWLERVIYLLDGLRLVPERKATRTATRQAYVDGWNAGLARARDRIQRERLTLAPAQERCAHGVPIGLDCSVCRELDS